MLTKGIMFLPDNCFDGINWRLIFLAGVQTAREGGRGAAGPPLPSSCYTGALATPYAVAMLGRHLAARSPRRGAHDLVANSGPACLSLYKKWKFPTLGFKSKGGLGWPVGSRHSTKISNQAGLPLR